RSSPVPLLRTLLRPVVAALVVISTLAVALSALEQPASASPALDRSGAEWEFVDRLNDLRLSRGLPAVVVNGALSSQSRTWSATMASRGGLSHDPALAAQTSISVPGWTRVGENVGV